MDFLVYVYESNLIRVLYEKKYLEALYLLAMTDYLSRIYDIPVCLNYNDIRCVKLKKRGISGWRIAYE